MNLSAKTRSASVEGWHHRSGGIVEREVFVFGGVMDVQITNGSNGGSRAKRRRWFIVVVVILGLLVVGIGIGLALEPLKLPSALIGKSMPEFELVPVKGRTLGLSHYDLRENVSLINVFSSWCIACLKEHSFLMEIAKKGEVELFGLNYRDRSNDAASWLNRLGDPYARTGVDVTGRVGIDWGVYGVPKTFIIGSDGRIAYKHIGVLNTKIYDEKIMPVVRKLMPPRI